MTDCAQKRNRVAVVGLCGMSALLRTEHLPLAGETVQAVRLCYEVGGKGMNQAVAAQRMGAETYFATAVGNDAFAAQIRSDCERVGLSGYRMLEKQQVASAFAAVSVAADGENTVTVYRGACDEITPEDIDGIEREIAESAVLLLQLEIPMAAVSRAAELGKKHGVFVILNTAPATALPAALIRNIDLITPNRGEAAALSGLKQDAPVDALVQGLRKSGFGNILITLGGDGSFLALEGAAPKHLCAFSVSCVDTTGAGDTFNGTLGACIANGMSIAEAAEYAAAASALCVTRPGVVAAIPTLAETGKFLFEQTGRNTSAKPYNSDIQKQGKFG